MQGKEFYGQISSLHKNASDWELEPSLIHHYEKIFHAVFASNPKFFPTLLVIPKRPS
jgi:hypothetical protein